MTLKTFVESSNFDEGRIVLQITKQSPSDLTQLPVLNLLFECNKLSPSAKNGSVWCASFPPVFSFA
jgi:hypothetical protein